MFYFPVKKVFVFQKKKKHFKICVVWFAFDRLCLKKCPCGIQIYVLLRSNFFKTIYRFLLYIREKGKNGKNRHGMENDCMLSGWYLFVIFTLFFAGTLNY